MKYIIYKTTNLINGKIYIGAHKTNNLNDGYLGSGKLLKNAIKKYGKEKFKKEILIECNSQKEMYNQESILVNLNFIENSNTYNFKIGGQGGWDYINKLKQNNSKFKQKILKLISNGVRQAYIDNKITGWSSCHGKFAGKHHTKRAKEKIINNNKNNYKYSTIESRLNDINKIELNKRGSITQLAKKWKVSHTQVRRFINKFKGNVLYSGL